MDGLTSSFVLSSFFTPFIENTFSHNVNALSQCAWIGRLSSILLGGSIIPILAISLNMLLNLTEEKESNSNINSNVGRLYI